MGHTVFVWCVHSLLTFVQPKLSDIIFNFIVVGNKNDCPEKKVVETDDATKFAEQMGIQLFETSAKENINVEEVRHTDLDKKKVKTKCYEFSPYSQVL